MQDTDASSTATPVTTETPEPQEVVAAEDTADAASACITEQLAAPREGAPEEVKFVSHAQFVAKLDLPNYGRKRTPMRFHLEFPLHKWERLSASPGIQICSGFDNMPRVSPLAGRRSNTKKVAAGAETPVYVATAGKYISNFVCVFALIIVTAAIDCVLATKNNIVCLQVPPGCLT